MILHCVFFDLKSETSQAQLQETLLSLADLQGEIEGLVQFRAGPNLDLEQKSQGFSHGFTMLFAARQYLEAYHSHPDHQAAGAQLAAICAGGADGIMVFDLEV